jgi:hypothetical protein
MGKRKDPLDTEYYSKSKVYRTNDLFMSMKSNQHPLTHADLENTHVQQHNIIKQFIKFIKHCFCIHRIL